MRKSIINLLLSPSEKVVDKGLDRMERYTNDLYLNTLTEVNRRLANHRRYCTVRGIDYTKIESGEAFK